MTITTEVREASTARVPAISPGKALIFTRYGEERGVVMNPDDFHRLAELDEALADVASSGRPRMSDLVLEARMLEDEPGQPLEEPSAIKALLGL